MEVTRGEEGHREQLFVRTEFQGGIVKTFWKWTGVVLLRMNLILGNDKNLIFCHSQIRGEGSHGGKQYLQDIGNHPDGPAVNSFAVRFLGENFRSCGQITY